MSRRALVTGASSGIGREIARGLAQTGMEVVLACRDPVRGEEALREIASGADSPLRLVHLDLSRLDSVRRCAALLRNDYDELDVLVNNAGVSTVERTSTPDGIEWDLAVNHVGPFLLTNLLLPLLLAAKGGRIVNVASSVHKSARLGPEDPQLADGWQPHLAYANTKLANILFTEELARRLAGTKVTANCYNPGLVRSGLFRNYHPVPFMLRVVLATIGRTPAQGADTGIWLATSDEVAAKSGGYFEKRRPATLSLPARDMRLAQWLWDYTVSLIPGGVPEAALPN